MIRYLGVLLAAFVALHAEACVQQDITFLIDSSEGVGADNFRQQLEFIKSTINDYEIGPGCIRVSIVTYSDGAHNQFYLDRYQTKPALLSAIDQISYVPGRRHPTEGLKFVTDQSFSTLHGGRTGVPHIAVMTMNGPASNNLAFQTQAQKARDAGIKMYTIGIGTGPQQQQMAGAASGPHDHYALSAQNFAALGDLGYPVSSATSTETVAVSPTTANCLQQADLVFLVDGSGSIGAQNFQKLKTFLSNLVGQLDVGQNKVHVGLMEYSNYPNTEFPLGMYNSRQDVIKGINNMKYMAGGTNTGDAIKYMNSQMFSTNSGARNNVPRIAITITDGRSSNPQLTASAADQARLNNIGMLAVGVGQGVDMNELHSISDNPDSANTFTVNSYDQLQSIATQIINKACQVRATTTPHLASQGGNQQPDPCSDLQADCKSFGENVCIDYAPWAKDNCARFCGICTPLYTTAPPECKDLLPNCPGYHASVCSSDTYKGWAQDNCRKFCGYCGPSNSAVGYYGQCNYKGKTYSTGESWTDGCDYQCTCEDGNSGKYRCYNRCPLYYNLPAQCTLVRKPSECCQEPVCNFNQNINKFELTAPVTNPSGIIVCSYKGKQYFQGQTWQDGCQSQCTCSNGNTGLIQCQSLCPQYQSLPPYCHLEKKAGECCSKPVCEFSTQQGSFTGTGSISGPGVGLAPTPAPACQDALPNCDRYDTASVCTGFKGWASDNCRKTCNLCNNKPTPGPNDTCIYQGKSYTQGQGWQVNCDTRCVCEDAVYGYYRCTNTCPTYNNLPQGCYATKKAGECCSSVQCDNGKFLTSTNNLNTIGSGGSITIQNPSTPQIIPTLPSGAKPAPGTGGTGFVAPSLKGCLYKGNMYLQDQSWDDECSYTCRCTDANTGYYSCTSKCPTYMSLPATCHMEQDPAEPCCQKPKCNDPSTPVIPVFQQGNIGHGVVAPPSITDLFNSSYNTIHYELIYTNSNHPPTANPNTANPTGIGYCMYKNNKHLQGESWQDGCQYNCVCEDASIGKWRCRERCQTYSNLPPICHMVQDPSDSCCQVPKCVFTPSVGTVNGSATPVLPPTYHVTQPTTQIPTTPRPSICVYNGKQFGQGQIWYDGCKYKCSCDNAALGFFRCTNRCPEYLNVPDGCVMVPDSKDPACCQVPQCNFQTTVSSVSGQQNVPTVAPGTFQGQNPDQTIPNIGYCLYKGNKYNQGQDWLDGCDYKCTCLDAARGRYSCTDRCPQYGNMPYPCTLKTDFRNPCCNIPDCNFAGTAGEITGTLTPAPHPGGPTLAPVLLPGQPTPAPKLNYCIYHNSKYYQGQTWDDGCDKRCRCDDASRGLYVCDQRCPSYANNLPKECTLVVSQTDPCCQEPKCDIPSYLKNITGTISPDMIPTLAPPGRFTGAPHTPAPTPGPNPGPTPAPQPLNYCEYKGGRYQTGQTWDDGCQFTCVCDDGTTGKYSCTEKCGKYGALPQQCYLQKDPANPCCSKPACTFNPTANQISGVLPTQAPSPGVTNAPTPYPGAPTPNPYPTPALPKDVCVYKGKSYTQGQQWYDGCEYTCTCENAPQGVYRCNKRCAEYQNIPAQCTMTPDPNNPICCKVPTCSFPPNYGNATGYVHPPTPAPGVITGGSVTQAPTPAPQPGSQTPTPGSPGQPTPGVTPVPKDVCVYKGKTYSQGQKWTDGCAYNCECVDAHQGNYKCVEKCARYPAVTNTGCQMVTDPYNPCCKVPYCSPTAAPNPQNTPVPNPQNTPAPNPNATPAPKAVCTYNGVPFAQGAQWDDGCDLKCVCEDANKGYYRCVDRCAKYASLPAGCVLTTDPNDQCCRVPSCQPVAQTTPAPTPGGQNPNPNPTLSPNPNPNPNPTPQPNPVIPTIPAVINGQGVTPSPSPGAPKPTGPPVCLYKGVTYQQGQTWKDGCDLNCECTDANTGRYRCTQRCQRFFNLPGNCQLTMDPNDACCKMAVCSPTPGPTPNPNPNPNPNPTLGPGMTPNPNPTPGPGVNPNPNPTLGPGMTPNPNPTPGPGVNPNPNPTLGPGMTPNPNPTPGPGINPNPNPTLGPGINPNPNPTLAPQPKVCIMNGRQYTQGQQWFDGCSRKCVCEDGTTGFYRCSDRCQKYTNVPSQCTMVADPNDPQCCQIPNCIPTPGVNGFPTPNPTDTPQLITGAPLGVITGNAPKPTPTPSPNVNPTPAPGVNPSPGVNPTPSINPTPAPKSQVCVYKGTDYNQGQRWVDGCQYTCVCTDGMTGHYECTERCPKYPNLPAFCRMVADPKNFCCQIPLCDFNNVPTPAPNVAPTPKPGNTPVPIPGQTVAPSPNKTPAPTLATCIYKGIAYHQGQTWNAQGCDKKCRCDDADKNLYTCYDRCATYPVRQGCTLATDPNDACCQIPQCYVVPSAQPTPQPNPNQTPNPNPQLNPSPGTTLEPGPNHPPTPQPGLVPTANPNPSPVPTGQTGVIVGTPPTPTGKCEYKGRQYSTGQTWDDGCTFNCECVDEHTGQYRCTERCQKYVNIPAYCVMVQDPNDMCCRVPSCPNAVPTARPGMTPAPIPGNVPNPNATPAPIPGNPTPAPIPGNPTPAPIPGNPTPNPIPGNPTPNPIPGNPTPAPNPGNPTPVPGTTLEPFLSPKPSNQPPISKDVCIMNGKSYTQGQTWNDGCEKNCVCDDGKTGHYTCLDRCSKFNNIAPNCILVPDPSDPTCCKIPQCTQTNPNNPTGVVGQVTGNNPYPTPAPNPNPTPNPNPYVTPNPNPNPNPTLSPNPNVTPNPNPNPNPTLSPNPNPNPNPTLSPNPNPNPSSQPTAAPPKVCVYKNSMYQTGQRWRDGCKYNCVCDDGMTGKYTCTDICPRYPNLPAGCVMVKDMSNPCCDKPDCNPATPSPAPGQTPNPNPTVTPTPQFCVYKGIPYSQGQSWKDGCSKTCRCEDAASRQITCDDRCPTYPQTPAGCTLVTDPNDQCCQVPQCVNPNPTNPNQVVTGSKGTIDGSNLPQPGINPGPNGKRNVCLYNGKMYQQGQRWDDGCKYQCICTDGSTGHYQCTDRCMRIPQLPSYCTMIQDPSDQCCQKAYCPNAVPNPNPTPQPNPNPNATPNPNLTPNPNPTAKPNPNVTPNPNPGLTPVPNPMITPAPTPKAEVCTYKNQNYQQDQVWYDDCNAICRCESAKTGFYRCQERCAKYPSVPSSCILVPSPSDPSCCKEPSCPVVPTAGPTPAVGLVPNPITAKPGVINGYAPYPTPNPNQTPAPQPGQNPTLAPQPGQTPAPQPGINPTPNPGQTPTPKTGCYYKGITYAKGTKWDDGCQYQCECLDDMSGQYKCEERCNKFPNLPRQCVLVQDPSDLCCQKPYCDFVNPTPFPNGIPTPNPQNTPAPNPNNPNPNPQNTPAPQPTAPKAGYCVYKGVFYTQGQQWKDGCTKTCTCDDSSKDLYTCTPRCPTYNQVPSNCQLRTDPNDNCCLVPDCTQNLFPVKPTGQSYTGAPTPAPTPGNPVVVSPGTNPGITGSPQYVYPTPVMPGTFTGQATPAPNTYNPGVSGSRSACVYKGNVYTQGQTWDDGCQYRCQCIDANRGQYRCQGRCGRYYFLPPQCTYVTDPKDQCCKVARCNPNQQSPNPNPTLSPTPNNPVVITPGPGTGNTGTNPPIVITPGPGTGNTGTNPPIVITPGPGTGNTGTNPPIVITPGPGTGNTGTNSPVLITPGPGTGNTGTNPPIVITPGPGTGNTGTNSPVVITPGPNTGTGGTGNQPNPQTTSITGTGTSCVYKGKLYPRGKIWEDGCDYNCVCDNPATNSYRCVARCKAYSTVPSFCHLSTDPVDKCCETIQCNPSPNGQQLTPMLPGVQPTASPTLAPNKLHIVPIGTHDVFTGAGHPTTGTTGSHGARNSCVYNGKVYSQGQSWDDGCKYTCTCQDGSTGLYKCATKCPKYPPLPSYCSFVNVPGLCCPSLSCNSPDFGKYTPAPELVPTPSPSINPGQTPGQVPVAGTTVSPHIIVLPGSGTNTGGTGRPVTPGTSVNGFTGKTSSLCIYKNKLYNQGDSWDDGCDYHCTCMDGHSGYYQCKPLCPQYNQLPSQCFLIRPAGQCCSQPMCSNPDGSQVNPLNGGTPYPVYGSYGGGFTGFKPNYVPGTSGFTNRTTVCIYKGQVYQQGSKWTDGCDYQCTCTDASRGMYQCNARCPTYTAIPSQCRMYDVPGQCCQEVRCDTSGIPTTPSAPHIGTPTPHPHLDPNCYDLIDNCNQYGAYACNTTYESWAKTNCKLHCKFCTPSVTPAPQPCVDKQANCADYGQSACTGLYKPWAMDNCRKYCGLCSGTSNSPSTVTTQTPNTGVCRDVLTNCASYGQYACQAPYVDWAHQKCQHYCGFCTGTGTQPQQTFVNALPSPGWVTMLKGVAGAPGDLYQLWNSPATMNANVPQAMYLTSQFPGHFKPDLSNHWSSMCIDQVKVSIYNKGVEKAWIIFNAKGKDKNSWFDPNNVISSSYTDIKNAPKDIFSLMGDVSSGREFYMSGHSNGACDSYGWIMVATKNGCPFEASSSGIKPAFLYAPGQSMAHWGETTPGQGDVFTIQAHQDLTAASCTNINTTPGGFTSRSNQCVYNNKIYQEGDTWTDGCKYNCTCEDGATGFYRCRDLCATFTNLPQGCTLVKQPGECCAVPNCGGFTLGPNGQGTGFCYYNGQMYQQGQTWNDGCKYKCTCTDATNGRYTCNDRCYNWNLPADLCHLEQPTAGKCCPTPKCSGNVVIQYPPGYVAE